MEQTDLLRHMVETLSRLEIPYAVVGSFASGVWGESRFTQDIDVVLHLPPGRVAALCASFAAPEFYVSEVAARDAVARGGQFNVIHPASGNKIDFILVGDRAWQQNQLHRRITVQVFPDCEVAFAAPEDVILGKLFYYQEGGSEKHLRDIAGILRISGEVVDRDLVAQQAELLGVAKTWKAILARLEP